MKKKAKGMTLIEVVISIAILSIVFGVIYLFFFSSNRILSDADVKEQLQSEGHKIEDKITTLGMEASNIIAINDSHNDLMGSREGDVRAVKFNIVTKDATTDAIVNEEVIVKYDEENKSIYYGESTDPNIMTNKDITGLTLLSSNVENFTINSTEIDNGATTPEMKSFQDTKSIQVNIILNKRKGYSDITRKVSTVINFRN